MDMLEQEIIIHRSRQESLSGHLFMPQLIHPFDTKRLGEVHTFLMAEAVSHGGNIRDKTVEDIQWFAQNGGQIWAVVDRSEIVAVQTLDPMRGARVPWWYINNGHTTMEWRGQGIASELVEQALALNGAWVGYFVIYVRQNLFDRLGFQEVGVDDLVSIDEHIAQIVRGKLRPDKEAHVFIRIPQQ